MNTHFDLIDQTQYLSFHIAGEEYAIPVLRVKEIIEYETVTRVPATPPAIRGVINMRGSVIPVVDLAIKFGLPETAITKWTCVVIVELEQEGEPVVMGVMADNASQVLDLGIGDIVDPPSFGTQVNVDYLLGMAKAGRKFTLILDIDRLLSSDELLETRSLICNPAPNDTDPVNAEIGDGSGSTGFEQEAALCD